MKTPAGTSRGGMDDDADPLDVLQERRVSDVGQRLHFEPIRQRQFVQFGGDGLGAQGVDVAGHDQVHIGTRAVGALGPRTKNRGRGHLGMTPEDGPHQVQLGLGEGWRIHDRLSGWRRS